MKKNLTNSATTALALTFVVMGFLAPQWGMAQATLDRTVTVENPDATGKISVAQLTDMANKKMAEDLLIEYVGAETYAKNQKALTAKVINNTSKFTPFQKAQDLERGPFGARLTVQYKVSVSDFRKLLSEAGIFSKTRLAQSVLAFMVLEDDSGDRQALSWKNVGSDEQQVLLHDWLGNFKRAFEKAGYTYNKNVNPAWLETFSTNSSPQDVISKNSVPQSLILWGTGKLVDDPRTKEKVLVAKVKVFSQEFKKEVTDSVRRFRIRDESQQKWEAWGQDLIAQLDDVDAKSLNQESMMKLTFKGSLPLMDQDSFKQWILNSSPLIKSVTERKFESKEVIYELETDASADVLAAKFGSLEFKGKKFKTQSSQSEVRLEAL